MKPPVGPAGSPAIRDEALWRADLLARRLALVGEASALNAQILQLTQQFAGMEMEALRLELEQRRDPERADLADELEAIGTRLDAARVSQDACAEALAGREQDIAEIDRELAIAMAKPNGRPG